MEILRRPGLAGPAEIRASLVGGTVRLMGVAAGSRVRVFDTRGMQVPVEDGGNGEPAFRADAGVYQVQVIRAGRTEVLRVVAP